MTIQKTASIFSITACCTLLFTTPLIADTNCQEKGNVDSVVNMIKCGSIDGSIRFNSYTLNNAYFSGRSQDTTSIGGFVTYKTAPFYGFQVGLGIEGQHRLAKGSNPVGELADNEFGLGEAYLKWQYEKFSITAGNQRLNLPFVGDYGNFRVLPFLYRAADIQYGDKDNFIRATAINEYKSYATNSFNKGSRLKDDPFIGLDETTDGMLALGGAKKFQLGENYLKGQIWVEHYIDLLTLYFAQTDYGLPAQAWKPELGLQAMYGHDTGDSYLGNVDSKIIGGQVKFKPIDKLTWKLAYNHMFNEADAWHNGALPTPYAHNVSSGPIFAQPFFTSTQDLGAGNAWSTELTGSITDHLTLGGRLTHVRAANSAEDENNRMTEYLISINYKFYGSLEGLVLSNFAGMQKREGNSDEFWQNRLQLTYNF